MVKMEDVVATSQSLSDAVSNALGVVVIMEIGIEKSRNNGAEYLVAGSVNIPLATLGPARFMFKELRVGSFGGFLLNSPEYIEENNVICQFELHFSYEHQTGGSNGCGAGFGGQPIIMVLKSEYSFKERATVLTWTAVVGRK